MNRHISGGWIHISLASVTSKAQGKHEEICFGPKRLTNVIERALTLHAFIKPAPRDRQMFRIMIENRQLRLRQKFTQDHSGAGEQTAADDQNISRHGYPAKDFPPRLRMAAHYENSQPILSQHEPFQTSQAQEVQPSQHRWPAANVVSLDRG